MPRHKRYRRFSTQPREGAKALSIFWNRESGIANRRAPRSVDVDGPGRRAAFVSIVVDTSDCVGTLIPMNNVTQSVPGHRNHSAVGSCYDAALAGACLDQESIKWIDGSTLSVLISGERYTARVHLLTPAGVRAALSAALGDYCVVHAVADANRL